MTIGSVGYAAPEQLMGEPIDGRTDQYSLAATAFHLLTGTMPFRDSNPAAVISKQLTTPAPVLSERCPDLANLDRVLAAALTKDPNQRYPHCLDFAEALSRASRQHYARGTIDRADATLPISAPSARTPPGAQADATEALILPPTGSDARSAAATPTLDATQWADALSAFFAERWAEAAERFETLQASHPGEARVETRLKEARRQRDIDVWSGKAEASAAEGDWDTVVTALENLTALDPASPDVGARLEQARAAQRRKALLDEMTALHRAGRWNAVVAAARELARIEPDNSDPGGIVSDAQAKIREADLPDRYAQALNHLDQEQWQQGADLLATIEQEHPGYRDADALLKTARKGLRGTAEVTQRPASRPRPEPQTTTAPPNTTTPPDPVATQRRRRTSGWLVAAVSIVVIGVALVMTILALVQRSKSSNTSASTSTSTSTSAATSSAPSTRRVASAQASGPNETIADYINKNKIQETTITHGTPGAPMIDLAVPEGWTRIPEGADAPYGGIVFNAPTNPNDPPKIIAIVEKLTGNVDPDKLLAVAPGGVKNLPGFSGNGGQDKLSGYPAYQLGGSYTKNGVTRLVAQQTVVIQSKDAIYVLQLHAEGPQADADALRSATVVVGQKTTITP